MSKAQESTSVPNNSTQLVITRSTIEPLLQEIPLHQPRHPPRLKRARQLD